LASILDCHGFHDEEGLIYWSSRVIEEFWMGNVDSIARRSRITALRVHADGD
jgi:hypothetical protein